MYTNWLLPNQLQFQPPPPPFPARARLGEGVHATSLLQKLASVVEFLDKGLHVVDLQVDVVGEGVHFRDGEDFPALGLGELGQGGEEALGLGVLAPLLRLELDGPVPISVENAHATRNE